MSAFEIELLRYQRMATAYPERQFVLSGEWLLQLLQKAAPPRTEAEDRARPH